MLLSIVIPVYARPRQLDRLLSSIAQQSLDSAVIQVVVVENKRCLNRFWLEHHKWPFRFTYGFMPEGNQAACRNAGVRLSTADRVLFLDSDIELPEHALAHLLTDSAKYDRTIVMADVVHPPGSRLTLATHLFDVPQHFRGFRSEQAKSVLTWRTFTSCAFIIHRAEFERIGGFADSFIHYGYEDGEFALRAEQAGLRIYLSQAATVFHHKRLAPEDVFTRYFSLGRSSVHFTNLHPNLEDAIWGVKPTRNGDLTYPRDFDYPGLIDRISSIEEALSRDPRYRSSAARKRMASEGARIYGEIAEYGNYTGIRRELWGGGEHTLGVADPGDWGQWGKAERRQEDALFQNQCGFLTWENRERIMQDLEGNTAGLGDAGD
ncbi:MAG: glycosyltransferase family 2 protein [Candidatus Dormibacteria bacterium]